MLNPALGETIYLDFETVDQNGLPVAADMPMTALAFEDDASSGIALEVFPRNSGGGPIVGGYYAKAVLGTASGYEIGKTYNVRVFPVMGADHFVATVARFRVRRYTIDTLAAIVTRILNKVAAIGVAAWMNMTGRRLGPFEVTYGDSFNAATGNRITFAFVGLNSIEGKTVIGQLRVKNGELIATLTGSPKTFSADLADIQEAYVDINASNYSSLWTPSREGVEHEILCKIDYGGTNISTVGRADVVILRG